MAPRISSCLAILALSAALSTPAHAISLDKLDPIVQARAAHPSGRSMVIVTPLNAAVDLLIQQLGGTLGRSLPLVNGRAADVSDFALTALASSWAVQRVVSDRPILQTLARTAATIGADAVRQQFGYDGTGIGVAVIDSGIGPWHDDLTQSGQSQRVARFVDYINGRTAPYDDYGHGTHVAGIIAGNGFDSSGARTGIAPAASLVVLKVLDASGGGRISNVIAAFDYVLTNRDLYDIRVVNVSIGANVYESYQDDLLTLAARRLVEAGIVVVAAAGNLGRNTSGQPQYGGITAPGNAPWVLTVGASSHQGTLDRADDIVAAFSSRGPTNVDRSAKPDVVAPGVGIESLSEPASQLYSTRAAYLLNGTVPTSFLPYLSLSGTSMAAPVVAGTVALMLQANPALTPNAVKAIIQYTSQFYADYDALTQGAGFLNAYGAVTLARYFANPTEFSGGYPAGADWSRQLIWGNRRVAGGQLKPNSSAWSVSVEWGARTAGNGSAVVWGARCGQQECDSSVAGTGDDDTVVWGTEDDDTVVWGTADDDTVVWGTTNEDTVVWGTQDDDTVVWGTSCGECEQ
jgi:serine protease AprX